MKLKLDGYFLGPMLHHPIFLKRKSHVARESRTLISVPVVVTFILKHKNIEIFKNVKQMKWHTRLQSLSFDRLYCRILLLKMDYFTLLIMLNLAMSPLWNPSNLIITISRLAASRCSSLLHSLSFCNRSTNAFATITWLPANRVGLTFPHGIFPFNVCG